MSELISSGQIVKKPEIVIDNNFFFPPNVVDVREKGVSDAPEDSGLDVLDDGEAVIDDAETDSSANLGVVESPVALAAPSYINVVSQTVRFSSDGTQVVDVVVEVEDIPGVTEYDIRVTKA